METNKVPTAEEVLIKHNGNDDWTNNQDAKDAMIEFARLHVQAALQKASHQIDLNGFDNYDDKIILNSYPENLIK